MKARIKTIDGNLIEIPLSEEVHGNVVTVIPKPEDWSIVNYIDIGYDAAAAKVGEEGYYVVPRGGGYPVDHLTYFLPREDSEWEEYYLIEVQSTKPWWDYQSWNYLGASCNCNFNFKEHVKSEVLKGEQTDLCFRLCYIYNSSSYGNLKLIIYDYGDIKPFNLK